MLVQLDEETWEVSDTVRLEEVLANLSDRAQAEGRLVTQLTVDNQPMTDRELVPLTLARVAGSFGAIAAKSEKLDSIIEHSGETAKQFGQQIGLCAKQLVEDFRHGRGVMRELDQWFGQMADYLEWSQIQQSIKESQSNDAQDLSYWVNELINARQSLDEVRMADMLEYEVIPRLPQ
ncbi:MAG: hypothetical protein JSU60_01360 [Nitrospirota bacterium]|nr:MAG: hypothetical protein JSU60_01360 [Nitrospirota bacterium]